ncbi:MAG TPA: TonB C-terminal domain-containing protein [Vicinamibacterales bacterium]|nr:TonB C-terminal domain-containing protein [Vicinamibacterales bacterium]
MYFNFDEDRPDTPRITQPISRREVVLLTTNLHALLLIAILLGPKLPWVREALERQQQELAEQQRAELERQKDRARFVFVQPRVDLQSLKPPPRADLSDLDRQARTVERAPNPSNSLPFSRGNSPERMEAEPPAAAPKPAPEPSPSNDSEGAKPSLTLPDAANAQNSALDPRQTEPRGPAVGVIADAIRNVRRYAQQENFGNLRGGQDQNVGESIQFDSKGVEFGPWLARFIAQVRSNWMIPQAAMSMRGHVSITFFVHKDGRITDVAVARPSAVDAFTLSGRNAILTSNPTIPLPPEYPDPKAFFTVTFYFNEQPPGR